MRPFIYSLLVILSSVLVSSCSFNKSIIITPSAQLNKPNFRVIKTATGIAEAVHVLGFGGMKNRGLANEAKLNLYKNVELKANQTIANTTLDQKTTLYLLGLYWKEEVIVSADVVEFYAENSKPYSEPSVTTVVPAANVETKTQNAMTQVDEELMSTEEKTISRMVKGKNFTESKYASADEVNKGDYVKITTDFGEFIYGKVMDVSNPKKLSIKYYSPSHTPLTWEASWTSVMKVTLK